MVEPDAPDVLLPEQDAKITMGGIRTGDNSLDFSTPLLLFQILHIISTTRTATVLLSSIRLPRYIFEILGGKRLCCAWVHTPGQTNPYCL